MSTVRQGNIGEDTAEKVLKNKGFKIVTRNYRCKHGEIDIIAKKDGVLYFVEVKARWGIKKGYPEEAVDAKKLKHIKNSIYSHLQEYKGKYKQCRILVIAILFSTGKTKYKLITVD